MDIFEFATRYTAAWCSRRPERVAAHFAQNGSLRVNDGTAAVGPEAIADVARSFMTAFPDLQVRMDDLVATDGGATYHWTLTGTSAVGGKPVRISGYEEWSLSGDGLIATSLGHFDAEDYARQLA